MSESVQGSPAYENWLAYAAAESWEVLFEYELYSDADAVPELTSELGPYQILRTIREVPALSDCPSLILRVQRHRLTKHLSIEGDIKDELAALLSLLSGSRILAAHNYSRRFGFNDDPLGQPIRTHDTLVVPKYSLSGSAIRAALWARDAFPIELLKGLPTLRPEETVVLAQSALLYQQGLWYAEVNPHYTWLMLVSAAETAANSWAKANATPVERLRQSRPNLEQILMEVGGEPLLVRVAEEIADYMGATKKFVTFLCEFMPTTAIALNAEPYQQWSSGMRKKTLSKIYGHRSRALHGGIPFPDQGPTTLETFEDITRGALLNWWRSMLMSENHKSGTLAAQLSVPGDA